MHIVIANISVLIGIEIMKSENLILDFATMKITNKGKNWRTHWHFKYGHVFINCRKRQVWYTQSQYRILHPHVFHPSADHLLDLVCKVKPNESGVYLLKTIKDITDACEYCRTYVKIPLDYAHPCRHTRSSSTTRLRSNWYVWK